MERVQGGDGRSNWPLARATLADLAVVDGGTLDLWGHFIGRERRNFHGRDL
jgi:hypothetical protein